jgi:hypothetical protein
MKKGLLPFGGEEKGGKLREEFREGLRGGL